jgi:hypothetical protein
MAEEKHTAIKGGPVSFLIAPLFVLCALCGEVLPFSPHFARLPGNCPLPPLLAAPKLPRRRVPTGSYREPIIVYYRLLPPIVGYCRQKKYEHQRTDVPI